MPIKHLIYLYNVPITVIAAKCSDFLRSAPLLTAGYSIAGPGSLISSSKSFIRRSYFFTNSIIASFRRIISSLNYSSGTG